MPRRFRDIVNKARRDLHEHMKVPALYLANASAAPLPVDVRDHTKFVITGQEAGNSASAEMSDSTPRILFFIDQLANARHGAIFSFAPGEAYRVERTTPPNGITRFAEVTQLSAAEAAGLPVPAEVS